MFQPIRICQITENGFIHPVYRIITLGIIFHNEGKRTDSLNTRRSVFQANGIFVIPIHTWNDKPFLVFLFYPLHFYPQIIYGKSFYFWYGSPEVRQCLFKIRLGLFHSGLSCNDIRYLIPFVRNEADLVQWQLVLWNNLSRSDQSFLSIRYPASVIFIIDFGILFDIFINTWKFQ